MTDNNEILIALGTYLLVILVVLVMYSIVQIRKIRKALGKVLAPEQFINAEAQKRLNKG